MSEQKQQREKLTLNIEKKEEFNGTTEIDYKSSNTLALSINSIFKEIFTDYNGCYVEVGNIAQGEIPISVIMDFTPGRENDQCAGIAAFKQIAQSDNKRNGSIISGMIDHNQMIDSKVTFEITQDAVDLLYDLLVPGIRQTMKPTPKAFQSRGIYVENIQLSNNGYGPTFGFGSSQQIYHEYVRMIDINAILKAMLPEKNRNGNKVIYDITPVRSMPNYFGFNAGGDGASSYLFAISQYDITAMTNIVREYGRPNTNASIQNRFVTV